MRLKEDFYTQDVYTLGLNLLGKVICIKQNDRVEKYRIVETESYGGATDRACHAYNYRRTERTEPLYLSGGHVYIYLIYGMYYMLNITANQKDVPEAVLIRAVEPLDNHEKVMKTNGPGKLCRHLGINKSYNQLNLSTSSNLFIEEDEYRIKEIMKTKRINIDYAKEDKDRLWRFYIKDNPYVSKK